MRTFTYAGPDGIEIPEFFSAEWLVLEDRSGELVTPPDVAEADGPLLRVELRPAHGEPWWLGVPLGAHELATVAHGLYPLPDLTGVLVALGARAWIVDPAVRGSAEPVDARVAGAVSSIVDDDEVVAVGNSTALVGYCDGGRWWAEPGNIDQVSLVAVTNGVLHAIGVLGGYQVVALEIDVWDGELLEEPEVIGEAATIQRVSERRFLLRGGPGQPRRGEARFDVERAVWRAPSVYGV